MRLLTGKRVIITGASSGLGQAIAIKFAKAGADIVFCYQNNDEGATSTCEVIQSCGQKPLACRVDLQNHESLTEFFEKAVDFLNGVDILVNNAGTLTRHPHFLDIAPHQFDQVLAVNIRAPFVLTQYAAQTMIHQKKGGSILNISSISATTATHGLAHYECAKAALNRFTQSAAGELAPYNIRVNAIAPGLFATNMNHDQRAKQTELWQQRCSHIPLKRAGMPEDITSLALLLVSDQGSLITGQTIAMDGGISINRLYEK